MHYKEVVAARFLSRSNRFVALVDLDGEVVTVHVKNTGRCKELLLPGATVYLEHVMGAQRKTAYDLIAVRKGDLLINMDAQAPNDVVEEWLRAAQPFGALTHLKREYKYGASRIDFYLEMGERKLLLEVKGVTLEQEGVVLFPDAPTERGVKHLRELTRAAGEGYEACVLFVVQMEKARYFTPNGATHLEFARELTKAQQAGVQVLAYTCKVGVDYLAIDRRIAFECCGDFQGVKRKA